MSRFSPRYVSHLLMTTLLKLSTEFLAFAVSPKTIAKTAANTSTATPIRRNRPLRVLHERFKHCPLSILTQVNKPRRSSTVQAPWETFHASYPSGCVWPCPALYTMHCTGSLPLCCNIEVLPSHPQPFLRSLRILKRTNLHALNHTYLLSKELKSPAQLSL